MKPILYILRDHAASKGLRLLLIGYFLAGSFTVTKAVGYLMTNETVQQESGSFRKVLKLFLDCEESSEGNGFDKSKTSKKLLAVDYLIPGHIRLDLAKDPKTGKMCPVIFERRTSGGHLPEIPLPPPERVS